MVYRLWDVFEEQAGSLAAEGEVPVRIDDERGGRGNAFGRKRSGHELVAPVRPDRDVDTGELAPDSGPRARRDDDGPRLERTGRGRDAAHAVAPADEAGDLVLLLDDHAEVPRARRDRRRAQVGVGVPVAGRVRRAELIVGVEVRAQLPRGRGIEQLHADTQAPLERDAA